MPDSNQTTIDLSDTDTQTLLRILELYVPGCDVWVFGSRVQGTARKYSDLDLALKCQNEIPYDVLSELRDAFIASSLPMRVDVLDWSRISPEFRKIIEAQQVLLRASSEV